VDVLTTALRIVHSFNQMDFIRISSDSARIIILHLNPIAWLVLLLQLEEQARYIGFAKGE